MRLEKLGQIEGMNRTLGFAVSGVAAMVLLAGCQTVPPGAERGPDGTMAYDVLIEATDPGARIEANGQVIGQTPIHLKIFGDPDGTFHDFGSEYYIINALPLATNQFAQTRAFGTGRHWGPEDKIPTHLYFDMNQRPPEYLPGGPPPVYVYPPPGYYYGPPVYYYRPYPYYYYRPGLRVYGSPYYHR